MSALTVNRLVCVYRSGCSGSSAGVLDVHDEAHFGSYFQIICQIPELPMFLNASPATVAEPML